MQKPAAYASTERDELDDSSDEDATNRTYESTVVQKPTIKVKVPKKFGNRYKYF